MTRTAGTGRSALASAGATLRSLVDLVATMSDEPQGLGGRSRAPDAVTYISAGIGFCFMTQFGRYAKIIKKERPDALLPNATGPTARSWML